MVSGRTGAAELGHLGGDRLVFRVVGVLELRQVEGAVARRAVSVANANDFSWRNRVAAWEGALQMMAERPWFGFGWNQPEQVYDKFIGLAEWWRARPLS